MSVNSSLYIKAITECARKSEVSIAQVELNPKMPLAQLPALIGDKRYPKAEILFAVFEDNCFITVRLGFSQSRKFEEFKTKLGYGLHELLPKLPAAITYLLFQNTF